MAKTSDRSRTIEKALENDLWAAFRLFVRQFSWIHLTLALIGNLTFFVGSVFFLWEATKIYGVWLFIIGAFGMLMGSIGNLIVWLDRDEKNET